MSKLLRLAAIFSLFTFSQPAFADEVHANAGAYTIYKMANSCRLTVSNDQRALSIFYPYVSADNRIAFLVSDIKWESLQEGGGPIDVTLMHGNTRLPGAWEKTRDLGFFFGPLEFESFYNRMRDSPTPLEFFLGRRMIFELDIYRTGFAEGLSLLRQCRESGLGRDPDDPFSQ